MAEDGGGEGKGGAGKTILVVLLVLLGLGLVCCGGIAVAGWFGLREVKEFAEQPPEVQRARLDSFLRRVVGDKDAVYEAFLTDLGAGDADAAWSRLAPSLQAQTTRADFDRQVRVVSAALGAYREKRITNANSRTNLGSADRLDVGYTVEFEQGSGTAWVELEEQADGSYRIVSWRVDSKALLEALERGTEEPR